jgi:hypothetical protein
VLMQTNANTISCDMTTPLVAQRNFHILATYSGSETNAVRISMGLQTTTNSNNPETYTEIPNGRNL